MAATGGVLYAFDINSLEDMRRKTRQSLAGHSGGGSQTNEELEEEIEAWIMTLLGKKAEDEFQKEKERLRGEREARDAAEKQ